MEEAIEEHLEVFGVEPYIIGLYWLAAGGVEQDRSLGLDSYGRGAIYFGWLGTAIGVIGMAHNWVDIDPDVLGPASAIAMLTHRDS